MKRGEANDVRGGYSVPFDAASFWISGFTLVAVRPDMLTVDPRKVVVAGVIAATAAMPGLYSPD